MKRTTTATLLALAVACSVSSATAQQAGKSLYWRRLDVVAYLEADGRLRVHERQTMVFNGEWNGGSRTFNIRPGQHQEFYSISRIDPAGSAHRLAAGDIDRVDHFEWAGANELRWRSRLPSDPPFANQEIVYEIDYALANILIPTRDGYALDHDFAFPNREGIIESFTLDFDANSAWKSATSLPLHFVQQNIQPGASVVVKVPLRYLGTGNPSSMPRPVSWPTRLLLVVILVGGFIVMVLVFIRSEIKRGRFEPLRRAETIDAAWLREHVFSIAPEVVGAAWDTTTGSPEVAAMVARMVQEGKLASRVELHKRKQILHLELKVARQTLSAEERKLIDALFADGETQTDTEQIRKRYSKSGFDPAKLIRKGIEKQVKALLPNDRIPARPRGILINIVAVMIVIAAAVTAIISSKQSANVLAPVVTGIIALVALGFAVASRVSVVNTEGKTWRVVAILFLAMQPVLLAVLGVFEAAAAVRPGVLLFVNLIVLFLGFAFLVFRAARTRETPARLELRRTLAAARSYFANELEKEKPALEDEWYPYLLAFGLGSHIDKWFRAYPAATDSGVFATSSSFAAGTASMGWSGGGPLFGGGGGFGGSGTGRSWASVAETFSAGVASPSSSSGGGGGGGGGSSSGGGGGGGW